MESDIQKWNRRMLNSLWIGIILSFLVLSCNYFFTTQEKSYYLLHLLIYPTLVSVAVMVVIEAAVKRLQKENLSYVVILAETIIVTTMISIHFKVDAIYSLLLFPVFTSTIYFEKKIVYISTALVFLSHLFLQFFHPEIKNQFDMIDFITFSSILLICSHFSIRIMGRIEGMLNNLRANMEMNHELLIQGILLEKVTKTDPLTGVYNRAAFDVYMEVLTSGASPSSFHLALFDIDNFKQINDIYGHHKGDIVLKQVAKVMTSSIPTDDIVARIGGEEFAIILNGKTTEESFKLLDSMREQMQATHIKELAGHAVSLSGGLHRYDGRMTKEQLFGGTDSALYQAKHLGKNQIVIC